MANDITKPNNHIYWQYVLLFTVVIAGIIAYKELRSQDDCLAGKIAVNEMSLRIQLTEIQTKLIGIETTLAELKYDLRYREASK